MGEYGKVLHASKTDSLKNGIAFTIIGIVIFIGSNFIYAKIVGYIISLIFVLIGLFLLIFKSKNSVIIYEEAIVINTKTKKVIEKKEIADIQYRELRTRANPFPAFYPVIIENDGTKTTLNLAFSKIIRQTFGQIIQNYLR